MAEKIIGFARISSEIQSNNSQIEKIKTFAQDNGMIIDTIFSIVGSEELSEETLDEALDYLEQKEINKIAIVTPTRISRYKADVDRIEEKFTTRGKEIIYLNAQHGVVN